MTMVMENWTKPEMRIRKSENVSTGSHAIYPSVLYENTIGHIDGQRTDSRQVQRRHRVLKTIRY
jgi:hypothetical protein